MKKLSPKEIYKKHKPEQTFAEKEEAFRVNMKALQVKRLAQDQEEKTIQR